MWPGWWPAWWGAWLLWRCMVLPHSIEAVTLLNCQYVSFLQTSIIQSTKKHQTRVKSRINCYFQISHGHISAAHPTNACSLQMWWHLKGNKLFSGIRFIAEQHCYNKKKLIYQTQMSLLSVLCLYIAVYKYVFLLLYYSLVNNRSKGFCVSLLLVLLDLYLHVMTRQNEKSSHFMINSHLL